MLVVGSLSSTEKLVSFFSSAAGGDELEEAALVEEGNAPGTAAAVDIEGAVEGTGAPSRLPVASKSTKRQGGVHSVSQG